MTEFKELDTPRCTLIPVLDDDINFIYQGLSHNEVTRFYGVHFNTLEKTKEQMKWYADLRKNQNGIWWKIINSETKDFIGACGFHDWNTYQNSAEIGLWLLPEFWGNGLMTEAIQKIQAFGFLQMNLNSITGFVDHQNRNCIKVLEKLGYVFLDSEMETDVKSGKRILVDHYVLKN